MKKKSTREADVRFVAVSLPAINIFFSCFSLVLKSKSLSIKVLVTQGIAVSPSQGVKKIKIKLIRRRQAPHMLYAT